MKNCVIKSVSAVFFMVFAAANVLAVEKQWHIVPINSFAANYGISAPVIDDIAISKDNRIYIISGARKLSRLEGEIWVVVDGREARIWFDKKTGKYVVPLLRKNNNNEYKEVKKVKLKVPDRMNGIAARVAVDSMGRLWVVTTRGRVYRRDSRNKWQKMPVMASDIVAGNGGVVAVWTMKATSDEHKEWLNNNSHPKIWNGMQWKDIKQFTELRSMAFDKNGSLWVLAGNYNAPNKYKLMRNVNAAWKEIQQEPKFLHMESDLHGNLWALTYKVNKNTNKNIKKKWVTSDERIFRWTGKDWVDDESIPNLHRELYTKPPFYGSLFQFRGNLTWASKQYWFSLRERSAEEKSKREARLKKKQQKITISPNTSARLISVLGTQWYGIIDVIDKKLKIDPNIVTIWKKGAYMHMRGDGTIGLNFEKPKDYTYNPTDRWTQDGDELILQMGVFGYIFKLKPPNKKIVANISNFFRMTIDLR